MEGFKRDRDTKIEVHRRGVAGERRCLNDPSIIALASDEAVDLHLPWFDINDAESISNFIEQKFLKGGLSDD